jgi:uncharacterized membrane protein YgcG
MELLSEMGPTQRMHYGDAHDRTTSTTNRAPSKLLMVLWLLRYAIHDEVSHKDFMKFLAPDTFGSSEKECSFPTVDFFLEYILVPIVFIIHNLVENDKSKVNKVLTKDYMKDVQKQQQKMSEFITYSLTSTFISIILHFGADVKFTVDNVNTMRISAFLNNGKKRADSNLVRSTNLYELFFAALPGIIHRNIDKYSTLIFKTFLPAEKLHTTKFPKDTTLENFEIQLPLKTYTDTATAVDFIQYFDAILSGKITLLELIGDIDTEAAPADADPQLRDKSAVSNRESSGGGGRGGGGGGGGGGAAPMNEIMTSGSCTAWTIK